jgi:phosphonate transport system substrate-binding protein
VKELSFMVCPHDTARNPAGWNSLAQYLTARLDIPIRFTPLFDFTAFRQNLASADLVYGNPTDALGLLDAHGFCPLVRPADIYDEAIIIAGPDHELPAIEAIHGAAVATVTQLLPTRIVLRALRERGITPASLAHRDSWLSVVRSVWNGEVPFGILYRDAYDELSPQGRAMVRVMESTSDHAAFHILCAGPAISESRAILADLLGAMGADPQGQVVLADLRIPGWLPVTGAEIATMRKICV